MAETIIEVEGRKYRVAGELTDEKLEQARSYIRAKHYRERQTGRGDVEKAAMTAGQGFNVGLFANVLGAPFDIGRGVSSLMGKGLEFATGGRYQPPARPDLPMSQTLQESLYTLGMAYPNIEAVEPSFRPFARAGETVGETVPFAAMPFAAARAAGTSPIVGPAPFTEAARAAPGSVATAEISSMLGAGVGSGVSESVFPGNPWARVAGEVAGGVATPLAIMGKATQSVTGILGKGYEQVKSGFTRAGAEHAAARQVQRFAKEFGGVPRDIAARLEEVSPTGARLTAGQKSEDTGLRALENKMVAESQVFGVRHAERVKENIEIINEAFRRAGESGNPEDLVKLAEARRQYWDSLLSARVAVAEHRMAQAGEAISPGDPVSAGVNVQARNLVEDALSDARKMESVMWGRIPKDDITPATNLRAARKAAGEGLLKGETLDLPDPIRMFISKTSKKGEATAGELLTLRSRILSEQRKMRGSQAPDWDMHRRLGMLSDAILDDLADLNPAAAEAREFSRMLNDRFSRGYVGRALGADVRGGERIAPELMLERGMGAAAAGRGPGRAVASRELEAAVTPFGELPPTERLAQMRNAEEQVIYDMARRFVDPETGKITPRSLERFRRDNAALLERFPELDRNLVDSVETTRLYGDKLKRLREQDKFLRREAAFAKVLPKEIAGRDVDVIGSFHKMMMGDTPVRDVDSVFRMARKTPEASAGARSVYLDYLFKASTDPRGLISGSSLNLLLDAYNGRVLASALKHGIIDKGQLARIRQIADEAAKLESALGYTGKLDQVIEEANPFVDILARVGGANIGAATGLAQVSGSGLVLAHAGSSRMRQLVEKIPANRVKDVMMEAIEDPFLMANLMRRPVNDAQWEKAVDAIQRSLERKGILQRVGEGIFVGRAGVFGQTMVPATLEDER